MKIEKILSTDSATLINQSSPAAFNLDASLLVEPLFHGIKRGDFSDGVSVEFNDGIKIEDAEMESAFGLEM